MTDHDITIVIDSVENDDWIRSLPGYQNELEIIRQAGELAKKKGPPTVRQRLARELKHNLKVPKAKP